MKKIASVLLTILLIISLMLNMATFAFASKILGDINGDGKVSVVDAKWILQIVAGLRNEGGNTGDTAPVNNDAASVANSINAATAKAASGSYKFHRNCVISNIDVGNATDTLNGIINKVDENADLNSVVGDFLDVGEIYYEIPTEKEECKDKYFLQATQLKAEDIQNLTVNGNTYSFTLPVASNPQKDNSTPLSRFTNDFITFSEVQTGVADALGSFSSLLKVESANVEFKDIKISVTMDNGTLKEIQYSYYMDVKELKLKATLVPITGTGYGTIGGIYSNFIY